MRGQPKHKKPRRRRPGGAPVSVPGHTGGRVSLGAIIAAAWSFAVSPPPSNLPDISWRGQGRDIRRLFRQVDGMFDTVYRREISRESRLDADNR